MLRFHLITNIVLMTVTSASIFYNMQVGLLPLGILLGLLFSLPTFLALLRADSFITHVVFRVNTLAIVTITLLLFAVFYMQLTGLTRGLGLFIQQLVCLASALGLCANSQQLASILQTEHENSVNSQLHRIFGGPSIALVFALALVITATLLSFVAAMADPFGFISIIKIKLIDRGIIPFITIAIFMWGLLLLIGNFVIVRHATRLLFSSVKNNPDNNPILHAFDISCQQAAIKSYNARQAQLQQFIDDIWNKVHYFYTLPRYINWAIPILGFIGTVFGISLAAESIGKLISSNDTGFSSALGDAVAPLGIAFDTTLVALSLSVVLMLLQSLLQRWQERQLHAIEQIIRSNL